MEGRAHEIHSSIPLKHKPATLTLSLRSCITPYILTRFLVHITYIRVSSRFSYTIFPVSEIRSVMNLV